jgi:predicted choloylglycine hydrolase
MEIFTIKGNNHECGFLFGRMQSKKINLRLKAHDITPKIVKKNILLLKKTYLLCKKKYPLYIEELKGLSEGSKIDFFTLMYLNFLELQVAQRCSSIAASENNSLIIAHNEDGDTFEKKRWFNLVKFVMPKVSFYSFMYPGELPGSSFSWNSHGMFFTINNLRQRNFNYDGIPKVFTARRLIESKTLNEAIRILKQSNSASGYHYFISDKKKILSIEQTEKDLSVSEVKGNMAHTNHYRHLTLKVDFFSSANSKKRLDMINSLLKAKTPLLDILFDKVSPTPIYNHAGDKNRTLASVIFLLSENKIQIYTRDSKRSLVEFDGF